MQSKKFLIIIKVVYTYVCPNLDENIWLWRRHFFCVPWIFYHLTDSGWPVGLNDSTHQSLRRLSCWKRLFYYVGVQNGNKRSCTPSHRLNYLDLHRYDIDKYIMAFVRGTLHNPLLWEIHKYSYLPSWRPLKSLDWWTVHNHQCRYIAICSYLQVYKLQPSSYEV